MNKLIKHILLILSLGFFTLIYTTMISIGILTVLDYGMEAFVTVNFITLILAVVFWIIIYLIYKAEKEKR